MFKKLYICLSLVFASPVLAQDVGFTFGIRSDSADTNVTGATVSGVNSVSFGAIMKTELTENFGLRLGMQYVPRQYQITSANSTESFRFTYFEVPVGLLYSFSDAGGFFFGPSFGFGLDKFCGQALVCQGVSNSLTSFQFGASFKFAPQIGLEVFYETGMSPLAPQLQQQRAVNINLMVTFD